MFERNLIKFSSEVYKDKFEVIADLAKLAEEKVTSVDAYVEGVKEREGVMPTYIEYGVAIPHAKTEAVKEAFVIYEKLENGVVWGEDGEVANYVFMIGVPQAQAGNLHLKIIAELSKGLMKDNFRNQLLNAENPETVYELLSMIEKEIVK